MKAWPVKPGVPAMGHLVASGAWHPGTIQGCGKCRDDYAAQKAKAREQKDAVERLRLSRRPVAPAGYEHRPREAARLGFRPPR